MQILQCNNETVLGNVKCHTPKEIEEFVKMITVETWSNYGKVDYNIHRGVPMIRYNQLIRVDRL